MPVATVALMQVLLVFIVPMGLALWFARDSLPMARLCAVLMGFGAGLCLLGALAGSRLDGAIAALFLVASYQLGHLYD